jgi:hypothetical protein
MTTMQTATLELDRDEAAKLYRKYKEHRAYSKPIDHEIERIYRYISQGKTVIRALESIKNAGIDAQGLPKLAIARADARDCYLNIYSNGEATMSSLRSPRGNSARSQFYKFDAGFFAPMKRDYGWHATALVPHIPPDIRPARGLQNYAILWEAEWTRRAPIDPYLIRRIGKGDMWLVVGAWDLTEVERGVLQDRMDARR